MTVPIFQPHQIRMLLGPTMRGYLATAMAEDGATRQGVYMRDIAARYLAERYGITVEDVLCDTAVRAYSQREAPQGVFKKRLERPV